MQGNLTTVFIGSDSAEVEARKRLNAMRPAFEKLEHEGRAYFWDSQGHSRTWGDEPGFMVVLVDPGALDRVLNAAFGPGEQQAVLIDFGDGRGILAWRDGRREYIGRRSAPRSGDDYTEVPALNLRVSYR